MTDRRLYALTIPAGLQTDTSVGARQQQSQQGVLDSDTGALESIAAEPGERPLEVEYPGGLADVRAAELRELAQGLSQPLPYYGIGTQTPADGYYIVEAPPGRRSGPVDPRDDRFQRVQTQLTKAGTIASHWRAVTTDPVQVDHPFGNTTEAPVGVPAAATKVRWYDGADATEEVTVQSTRTAEFGDVDILHARNSTFTAPDLIFELDYSEAGNTDPRVWDDRGQADRVDADGALQWQKVFAADHRFDGDAVLSSGLLRLFVDEPNNSITAEEYSSGSWSSLSLSSSDWELFDLDIRTIGLAQAAGIMEFRDPTQSPTAFHTLDWHLQRGAEDVLFATTDPVPSGLETLLDPIAADHIYDPYGDVRAAPQGLIKRTEVA